MKKECVYVKVDSVNYWWGVYGLAGKVGWEDITIFEDTSGTFNKIAKTCICTKNYLENGLEDLEQDPDEKEFAERVRDFLKCNEIKYYYEYDKAGKQDFYEVPFEAKRNEFDIKPCYIEIWHPSNAIDKSVIEESVIAFCKKFLGLDVERVIFKDKVNLVTAIKEYKENLELFSDDIKMEFSDDLVEQLMIEWGKSKEQVLKKLYNSVK